MTTSVDAIDAALPQTQCTKCGYSGCRPYAQAIAAGNADINRCPPGGEEGIARLAALTGKDVISLDRTRGESGLERIAVIDEAWCIGCTLCIQACPVDAIVGAPKLMHTVLFAECTGCELCIEPCPVDCIDMRSIETLRAEGAHGPFPAHADWSSAASHFRTRYEARNQRLARDQREREERLAAKAAQKLANLDALAPDANRKRAVIEAALARARARRSNQEQQR